MAKAKTGEKRQREPRFYPAYDVPVSKYPKQENKPSKLRASLTPGTVVILLAGRHRGKRCVMLKQLESGLLLVTGPYCVNGVPLRRVNAAYVIATSTKVDMASLKVDAKFNDAYFPKKEKKAKKDAEGEFFAAEAAKEPHVVSDAKKADQAALDKALLPLVENTPMLKSYLNCLFTLKQGMKPHEMKW